MNKSWKYKTLLFIVTICSWMPLWFFYLLSDLLYLIGFHLLGYRKKIVYSNLKNSFPEKTEQEITQIQKKFYHNFCDWIVESIKGQSMKKKNFMKRFQFVAGQDLLQQLINHKQGIILLSGHFFNWEWCNIMPAYFPEGNTTFALFQPATNKTFTDIQNKMRNRFGIVSVAMTNVLPLIVKNAKENIFGLYYFFADQAPPANNHFWTMFLNQESSFFTGGAKIAQKFDYAVTFLDIIKIKRGYYEVSINLITDAPKETTSDEITKKYAKMLEEHIKKQPENWLWSHNRWKRRRPENIPITSL